MEKKLDQIYMEVRDLNLRVTIVETRLEERYDFPSLPAQHSSAPQISAPPKKRGRPRKTPLEE